MTKITYGLVEMKTKYWCHKSEALKAIVIKTTYFHSGPRFFLHYTTIQNARVL